MAKFKRTLRISVLSAIMFFCGVMGIFFGTRTGGGKARAEETAETVRVEYVLTAEELNYPIRTQGWTSPGQNARSLIGSTLTIDDTKAFVTATVTATATDTNKSPQIYYGGYLANIRTKTNVEITYRLNSQYEDMSGVFYAINSGGTDVGKQVFDYSATGEWETIYFSMPALNDVNTVDMRYDYFSSNETGRSIDIQSIKFYEEIVLEELTVCGRTNPNAQFDYNIDTINGASTDGNNNKLNGWRSTVTEPTDFVLNGWIVIKSDDGSVGIDHYEYKIDDGAWTAIEGGIGSRTMGFGENTYIPDGKYDQNTAKIDNLTVPTASLGKGTYTVSLRAVTTNYKTVTMSWTYEFTSAAETVHVEYVMGAAELEATSRESGGPSVVNASLVNNTDYVTITAATNDSQLWYYNNYTKIKGKTTVAITYRADSTITATAFQVRAFQGETYIDRILFYTTKNGTWQTYTATWDLLADDTITQIRIDPLTLGQNGDTIDIKSIKFSGDVVYEELTVCGRTNPNAQFDYNIDTINGASTDGNNNKLNGWTSTVTEPTDFVLNGWIVIKSDDGSVGIDHYEYKIDGGAWTAIEGGIGSRNMWFTSGYIPNGKYDQNTAGISNLTVPTASLGKGVYTVSLRAVTTNFKTVTVSFTYNCQYLVTYGDTGSVEYVTAGEKATAPADPQKGGYTFVEWQLNGEKYNFDSPVEGDIALQAKYKTGEIKSVSLSLEGDIAVNLYIELPEEGVAAVCFTLGEKNTELPVSSATYSEGNAGYKFSFGVAAKDYTEAIGVSVIPVSEADEGVACTLTVKQIAETYLNSPEIGDDVKAVVDAMLSYCESARVYFAGETVTEALAAPELSSYAALTEGSAGSGVTAEGATLVLESQTSIKVYFSVQDGVSVACKKDGEAVEPVLYKEAGGVKYYYLEQANIPAKDLGKTYVFEIGGFKVTYSAMSYAYMVLCLSDDIALKNTVTALYNYYQAAGLYFYGQNLEEGGSFVTFADIPPQSNYTALIEEYAALGMNTYTLIAGEGYYDDNGYYVGNGIMVDADGEITEEYKTAIRRIQALGLNVFVRNADNSVSYFDSVTNEFIDLGVNGFFIADEPAYFDGFEEGYPDMPGLEKLVAWYNTYYAGTGVYFHCNLYGSEVEEYFLTDPDSGILGINKTKITYAQYIQYYVEHFATKVNGPVTLCFDNYPFREGTTGIRDSWFANLLYIANQAKAANATRVENGLDASVLMGFCVQTFDSDTVKDITCTAEISVQLCVGMAMGARVFEYYLYSTIIQEGGDGNQLGIIDTSGTGRIYSYVKEANDAYLPFQKVLSGFEWQGLAAISGSEEQENAAAFANMTGTTSVTDMGLTSVTATLDCVVGCFTRGEYKGYMIANCAYSSSDKTNTVTVGLGEYKRAIVYTAGGERRLVNAVDGILEIELEAGGGAFIVPVA